jgi:molybdate transport system substrate-binding protein
MYRLVALLLVAALILHGCGSARTDPSRLTIAAASDLRFALDEAIARFSEGNPGQLVEPIYGSSGNFFAQVSNGAPFDMFLSADMEYPQKLQEQGLALEKTEFEYAVGRLVVWVRTDSPLKVEIEGMNTLTDPSIKHVSIANPEHAPYGKNAVAAMKALGVYDKVKDRLVFGENVSQAFEFVESGSADIGIVAMSLAIAPTVKSKGRYWEIPLDSHPRMIQGGVILKAVKNRKAADQFRAFLLSDEGRAIFKRFGFYMPENSNG